MCICNTSGVSSSNALTRRSISNTCTQLPLIRTKLLAYQRRPSVALRSWPPMMVASLRSIFEYRADSSQPPRADPFAKLMAGVGGTTCADTAAVGIGAGTGDVGENSEGSDYAEPWRLLAENCLGGFNDITVKTVVKECVHFFLLLV